VDKIEFPDVAKLQDAVFSLHVVAIDESGELNG
jgi:hypothetical protein